MSKLNFLSQEWFDKVLEIKDEMGEIDMPKEIKELVLNFSIKDGDNTVEMCMNAGTLEQGHAQGAPLAIALPKDLAYRMLLQNDKAAGMQGFMSGKIQITGDIGKMMAMQTVTPTEEQETLRKKIVDITNC